MGPVSKWYYGERNTSDGWFHEISAQRPSQPMVHKIPYAKKSLDQDVLFFDYETYGKTAPFGARGATSSRTKR